MFLLGVFVRVNTKKFISTNAFFVVSTVQVLLGLGRRTKLQGGKEGIFLGGGEKKKKQNDSLSFYELNLLYTYISITTPVLQWKHGKHQQHPCKLTVEIKI